MSTFEERKEGLKSFVSRFKESYERGALDGSTEETIRAWINELLGIFGWDVQNTNQVLQEIPLEKYEREKLQIIGSRYTRPDYTLVNGRNRLAFVDAKSLNVNVKTNREVAFQIRSYGWSIGAAFSVVTNVREIAIYDCTAMPREADPANYYLRAYYTLDEVVDNLPTLDKFLLRENVIQVRTLPLHPSGEPVDTAFANFLGKFRVHLVEAIVSGNAELDFTASTLTLWAQVIIDRILFIRVCESRGLEEDGLLLKFKSRGFWKFFNNSSYCDFYRHYDGPMFSRIEAIHDLNIEDSVFDELLGILYYPSPYKFDVIPAKTISDIYDRFLSYSLVIDDGKAIPVLKDEYRKSKGAVTTPQAIVSKVISQTVDKNVMESMDISQILCLKMVDIACGSGVFLNEFYDYLVDIIKEKIKKGERYSKNFAFRQDGEAVLTINGKKEIIKNCIYGVDIDQEAVEVAKMSLSLKVVEDYRPLDFEEAGIHGDQILSGIGDNIKCGNSLVDEGILDFSKKLFDNEEELISTHIFSWRTQFPEVFKRGGFDFVIGNPPYVEVKNYNQSLPTMAQYIKKKFPCSSRGKIDLSIPFIERGLQLLNNKGRLGFIVQKRFFKTEYGESLRRYIRESHLLHSIYDYDETDLFAGKITYVAILVLDCDRDRNAEIDYCKSISNSHVLLGQDFLNDVGWSFSNLEMGMLIARLAQKKGCLRDSFRVQVGIQVLWVPAYHIHVREKKDGIIYGSSAVDSDIEIEVASCRHLICNENFSAFERVPDDVYAVFPYDVSENGKVSAIKFSDYSRRFPLAGAYLSRHKDLIMHKVVTEPMRNKSLDGEEYWHIYTRGNNLGNNGVMKVVIPMTTHYPQASIVKGRDVFCDNANVNFIQAENADTLYAIAGIVNSRVFGLMARYMANPSNNGYSKYNKQFLNPVPFPNDAFKEYDNTLDEVVSISKQIEQMKIRLYGLSESEAGSIQSVIDNLWNRIDEISYKLYGLNEDEIVFLNGQESYGR